MESIVLFDPSIRSQNLGDGIIMESAEKQLAWITRGRYVLKCATHAPAVTFYQNTRRNPSMRFYDEAKYKFVCGSNLLWRRMLVPRPTFNINPFNCMPYEGCVLLGVGTDSGSKGLDLYTKRLYKKILSDRYYHSTRDEKTKAVVEQLGLKAINTGCPTMWGFTESFCASVPVEKADNVIFTLTDYNRDAIRDREMIRTLKKSYRHVSMWLQGTFDEEHLKEIGESQGIVLIEPSLKAFDAALCSGDVDYVGTRLHAGMFALQHKVRSLVVIVDERVRSMRDSYGIPCIEREDIGKLTDMVNHDLTTHIGIDEEAIQRWLAQFDEGPVYA
ncbi:MAG: polysaccharide pyruvyl transferase family protein [Acidobacteriota bacterium]|nr:polysaccharide pyruvyl transferase family protein [Acidobacteriota bacterium]